MMHLSVLSLAIILFFPSVMAISMSMDLLTLTIPNWLSAALVTGYLVLAAATAAPIHEVLMNLTCGATVLFAAFLMFSFRWIGGGDAKMAAATALWIGWSLIVDYGVVAAICGGVLALILLVARTAQLPIFLVRWRWLTRLRDGKIGVPYGIALGVAGLLQYPHCQIWRAMTG